MENTRFTKETIMTVDTKKRDFSPFRVGDTVEVSVLVKEGNKERLQAFSGLVIAYRRHGIASTFTVRRIGANNVGVERIFPYYSPNVQAVKTLKYGSVRRAKLFYVRDRIGKAARVKEKILTKEQKKAAAGL